MAIIDDIGKKLVKSGQDTLEKALEKAKALVEITRLGGQVADEQNALVTFYAQIGEKYYSLRKDDPDEEYSQFCDRITAGLMRIAELNTEIQRLKGMRLCPKCGAACPVDAKYCSKCGECLPLPEPAAEPDECGCGAECAADECAEAECADAECAEECAEECAGEAAECADADCGCGCDAADGAEAACADGGAECAEPACCDAGDAAN